MMSTSPSLRQPSLYRRILGPAFEALPDVLRRFHDTPGGGRARGRLTIERPDGWLRNALANLLGLPRRGVDVPVSLDIAVEQDRERWVRCFDGQIVRTVQWDCDGRLMEALGPSTFSCALLIDGATLRYQFDRAWFCGILLPRRLAPHVESWVTARDGGWFVTVRIFAPFLGELVHYEGWLEPQ